MNWFYIDKSIKSGDRRQGPYTVEEMREFAAEATIENSTLVWHTGLENWIPWEKSDGFINEEKVNELIHQTIAEILLEKKNSRRPAAGFSVRAMAFLIDFIVLSLLGSIIVYGLNILHLIDLETIHALVEKYLSNPLSPDFAKEFLEAEGVSVFVSIWFMIQALYSIFFHARYGGTFGKLLLHLKVENANGTKLNLAKATIRYLYSVLTQFTLVFYGIGYLIAAIDPKKRALHDFLASTRVVYSETDKEE